MNQLEKFKSFELTQKEKSKLHGGIAWLCHDGGGSDIIIDGTESAIRWCDRPGNHCMGCEPLR